MLLNYLAKLSLVHNLKQFVILLIIHATGCLTTENNKSFNGRMEINYLLKGGKVLKQDGLMLQDPVFHPVYI